MNDIVVTLVLVAALVLIHFAYVDFRFRYRGGMFWFWTLNPAPPLMWVARGLVVAAIFVTFGFTFFGGTITFSIVAALMLAHLVALIVLEVREPR